MKNFNTINDTRDTSRNGRIARLQNQGKNCRTKEGFCYYAVGGMNRFAYTPYDSSRKTVWFNTAEQAVDAMLADETKAAAGDEYSQLMDGQGING